MTRRWHAALLTATVAVAGSLALSEQAAPKKDEPALKNALLDADRAFAKATAEKGLEGWLSFMANDAVRISPLGGKASSGKEAIRKLDASLFADPKLRLTWEPADAGAFADGNHGFTTGHYKLLARTGDEKEEVRATGAYVTCWRMGEDGHWKVILDTGASDPPKP